MAEIEPGLVEGTRVLKMSEQLGFPPVVVNPAFADEGKTRALREAFLSMAADPTGRALLAELRLDGFVETEDSLFDGIATRVAQLRHR